MLFAEAQSMKCVNDVILNHDCVRLSLINSFIFAFKY